MAASTTLTIRISPDLKARLGKLAEITQRTHSFLAAEAIEVFVERELEIVEGILRGVADVEAGRVFSHDEVMRRGREIIDQAIATEKAKGIAAE